MKDDATQGNLRIAVNRNACQGHNLCVAYAPELLETDETGHAFERDEGRVPAGQEASARAAVDSCPERAIALA